MKFIDLKKSLSSNILPCYILEGDDIFLLYKSLELIREVTVKNLPEFNEIVFSENVTYSANEIVEACLVLPLAGEKRLVVVKDCSFKNKEDINIINKYLTNPSLSACLVFFNSALNEFTSKLEGAELVNCNKLADDLVNKLIIAEAKKYNKEISLSNANILRSYCINDMARINGEVIKLVSYIGSSKTIEEADIKNNVIKELDFEIYEFSQAVASKQSSKAYEILNKLLVKKENFGAVLNYLYNQFSKMFFCAITPLENSEIASILGMKEYAVKKTKELASMFSKVSLKNIVLEISDTELHVKSGKISNVGICEKLIFKIIKAM